MNALDYPITTPYGYTGYPYSRDRKHQGNDRACKTGTPLFVAGQLIGKTGHSGYVLGSSNVVGAKDGEHLHTQEWFGTSTTNTRLPQHENDPGIVLETGIGSQWGKFITFKFNDGWKLTYCHLDEILVTAGQKVGNELEVITKELLDMTFGAFFGSLPTKADYDNWVGKPNVSNLIVQCEADQRRKDYFRTVQTAFALLNKPQEFVPLGKEVFVKKG